LGGVPNQTEFLKENVSNRNILKMINLKILTLCLFLSKLEYTMDFGQ
jgi:hypothetical protein